MGVGVTLGFLVGVASLLLEGIGGGPAGSGGDISGRRAPTRVGPTLLPGLGVLPSATSSPTSSPSLSPSRSAGSAPVAQANKPPRPKSPTPSKKPAPRPADPGYTGWAGPGCTTGQYREYGRYQNGYGGWYDVSSGGYRGSSCDGRFTAVPMSGDPAADSRGTAIWSWQIGPGYEQCSLAVYIPVSGRDSDVAGNPTAYRVFSSAGWSGHQTQPTFGIRQTEHRGSLVAVGSYRVEGESFAVQLLNRGQGGWGAHHAAAQMQLKCTA